jgi:predicted patatin/cPLA2 family phospholipase
MPAAGVAAVGTAPQTRRMMETVSEALQRRRASGRHHPPFDDGLRIALVAEGGAMRGVIAGGMVSAIESEGFAHCFDLMIGTSAGACALAYLRAGQARFGTRIFYEDINNQTFINPMRTLRRRPIVDIDFLVDTVFRTVKPLDICRLREPGATLIATATDVDVAETVYLTDFATSDGVFENLRATTQMPLLASGPVEIERRRLLDGGILSLLPLQAARAYGATHVVLIMTRPVNAPSLAGASWLERTWLPWRLGRLYTPILADRARAEENSYRRLYRNITPMQPAMIDGMSILAVAPAESEVEIGRMERSASRLRDGANHAEARMRLALAAPQR